VRHIKVNAFLIVFLKAVFSLNKHINMHISMFVFMSFIIFTSYLKHALMQSKLYCLKINVQKSDVRLFW